jgi:hypothetical protein
MNLPSFVFAATSKRKRTSNSFQDKFVSCLRRLISGFSAWKSGFNPRVLHVQFMVGKLALLPITSAFPCQSFHRYSIFTCQSTSSSRVGTFCLFEAAVSRDSVSLHSYHNIRREEETFGVFGSSHLSIGETRSAHRRRYKRRGGHLHFRSKKPCHYSRSHDSMTNI